MNTQIIAIANQKGGVGKTTTCANLGIGLAQAGKKVLLIDGDPQGSLTISLGHPQPDKLPFTLSDAMGRILMDEPLRPGEGILHHPEGVDLMPADIQLSGMEVSLVNAMSRETILRQYLDTLKGQYSHILIDCQPSLGMLTVNALAVANRVIIPVQAEYLPAKGLEQLLQTVNKVNRQINPKLQIDGILLTMVDIRTNFAKEIEALPDGPLKDKYWASIKPYRQMRIPQPDFVLCCNNICNCMTKWYENIARMCNIPLIMIDIPYDNTVEVHDSNVAYVRAQFDNAIHQLEELTGKKFDEEKFNRACANANRTASAWLRVCDYLQYKPAPYSGFNLFNHMADIVTARGKVQAAEAFELLEKDLELAIKEGTSTTPFPEKYRVMFEGIPCWPKLPNLFKPLKANGVNVTAVVYAPAFGFVYDDLDGMARAYYKAPNSVCIEQGVDWREGICRGNKVDGVLVHYNRSCKPWFGYMAEMQRRFTDDLGVPCAGFDGDQADPRNFNEAQYETRVQGLVEAMEQNAKNKAAKEG